MPPDQETMSFSKKRKSIQGFCTIGEATHLAIAAGGANEEDRKVQGGFSIAKNVMHKKESVVDEIEVRQVDATNSNMKINAESESEGTKSCSSSSKQKADPADFLRNLLTIDLTVRGIEHYKENIRSLDAVTLHREPQNAHDPNAICVKNSDNNAIGYVAKEQASVLAKPIDTNIVSLDNVCLKEQNETTLTLAAKVNLLDEEKMEQFKFQILPQIFSTQSISTMKQNSDTINDVEVQRLVKGVVARDTETASTCPFDILQSDTLPWKSQLDNVGMSTTWPPSQDILDQFGYGSVDDEQWWQESTGLRPPSTWNVTGALDLLPRIPIASHQKTRARDVLDDSVHGVTNVWSDATLQEICDLMHSPNFWCYRSTDAFIKAYGGPYVLGQKEGKLKLIKGAPHIPLTEKVCRAHDVVYELVHMTKPPKPGFNTLIFGLNLRGSGFHYHQDTITSLKAKNAALVKCQPVVTTVYYEKPDDDNGKEIVLWKPLLNFNPRNNDSLYIAARAVRTTHGMVHVQRAGLQNSTQHGIFHTPIFENGSTKPASCERRGYRVAITARITYPDADELLKPYLVNGHYCSVFGPQGNRTLQLYK